MKKLFITFFIMLLPLFVNINVAASDDIEVMLNNNYIKFDVPPQIINDRVMVPIRAILEAMGATVEWNEEKQTAFCKKGDTEVEVVLNLGYLWVNNQLVQMVCNPVVINGRILVPARSVAEAFDYKVSWRGTAQIVIINDKTALANIKYYSGTIVPDYGSYTDSVLIYNGNDAFAYFAISEQYINTYIEEYKNLLASLDFIEVSKDVYITHFLA